jgi:predicted Holliday junction resolvase-like endonuclease
MIAAAAACYVGFRLGLLRARLRFEQWKNEHTKAISRDAIRGSQAAVTGRVFERVAPYLPDFGFNPRDARFIGDPVDFVVFDGLSEGDVRDVVFVEVKSGQGNLNGSERRVKAAISARRVAWSVYRIPDEQPQPETRTGARR